MRSFLLQAHLGLAAAVIGAAAHSAPAMADVADDTSADGGSADGGGDSGSTDGGGDSQKDGGCGSKGTTGASLGLGLALLAGLRRRWE